MMALASLSGMAQERLWHLYVVLLVAAFLKYVVPPVPGDLASLAALFWIGMKGGSWTLGVAALTLGGTLGAWAAFAWGGKVGSALSARSARVTALQGRVERSLLRWGYWPLLLNRFVPYVRPLLFPTAGAMRMSALGSVAMSFVGNLLFGLFLVGLAYTAGQRFSEMNTLYRLYQLWIGLAVLGLLGALGLWAYLSSRRSKE
jgi:membrane protein DedA with SNARE-associated domain